MDDRWTLWVAITEVLVNVSILGAAIVAVIKLRLFSLLSRRFRSEVRCAHHHTASGKLVFEGDYVIRNTGERRIDLKRVTVELLASRSDDGHLTPDYDRVIGKRTFAATEPHQAGLLQIEPGERAIYPLRLELDSIDDTVFFVGRLKWEYSRRPASYVGLYVASAPESAEALPASG